MLKEFFEKPARVNHGIPWTGKKQASVSGKNTRPKTFWVASMGQYVKYPKGRPNQRRLRKLKNRMFKRWKNTQELSARIKTHDPENPVFLKYKELQRVWFISKKKIIEEGVKI